MRKILRGVVERLEKKDGELNDKDVQILERVARIHVVLKQGRKGRGVKLPADVSDDEIRRTLGLARDSKTFHRQ